MTLPKKLRKGDKRKGSLIASYSPTPCGWSSPMDVLKPNSILVTSIGSLIIILADLSKPLVNV